MVCGTTGERVWPRMTEDGARGLAGGLLNVLALLARFVGKDITPEKHEIDQLGRAMRDVAYRRASWVGAGDDLFALGFALVAFGMRVRSAPNVVRAPGLRLASSPSSSSSASSSAPSSSASRPAA